MVQTACADFREVVEAFGPKQAELSRKVMAGEVISGR
jgi:hypothetical protein